MADIARIAVNLTALAFVALGAAAALTWWRRRGRADALLAISLMLLAIVAATGRVQAFVGQSPLLGVVSVTAFLGSAYFVLLFRDSLIPLSFRARRAATVLLVVSVFVGAADTVLFAGGSGGLLATLLALELVLAWSIFIGEPIIRFWLASRHLPRMQRARMRALSIGFAVLIGVVVVAVIGGSALQNPTATVVLQVLALGATPIIYFSVDPPALLRGYWRLKETGAARAAMRELLLFSPSRRALAEKAIPWAMRLVGAHAAFVVGPDHVLLASSGIQPAAVESILAEHERRQNVDAVSSQLSTTIVVPLPLSDGGGYLGVEAGPFAPVFGTDELDQLEGYAAAITAGLERARTSERMAELEQNKSQFLNLASHELRGPVTVIRGYVSMLENGMCGDLNELGRKAAHTMRAQVLEMNELIEQMMDSARMEDGRLALRLKSTDLRQVARSAIETARPLVDEKHSLELELPDRAVTVEIDSDRIETILSNFISNAVKYSPAGGAIKCRVSQRNGTARVSVSDNGIGIAEGDLPVLFTRFGRVSNPETEAVPGTGLGLYLGRQLAHLHGGDITVESRPQVGSTFTLQLPLTSKVRSVKPPTAPDAARERVSESSR